MESVFLVMIMREHKTEVNNVVPISVNLEKNYKWTEHAGNVKIILFFLKMVNHAIWLQLVILHTLKYPNREYVKNVNNILLFP